MLSRREALIGAGAVVVAAALPTIPSLFDRLETFNRLLDNASLDSFGVIWGMSRRAEECIVGNIFIARESDADFRERIRERLVNRGDKAILISPNEEKRIALKQLVSQADLPWCYVSEKVPWSGSCSTAS